MYYNTIPEIQVRYKKGHVDLHEYVRTNLYSKFSIIGRFEIDVTGSKPILTWKG
jgi:hypothetical protein